MKAGGEQHDQVGRGHHAEGGQGGQGQAQVARGAVDQLLDLGQTTLRSVFRQDRNERLGEGTLGKQAAQKVGNLEGDEECVGRRPRTEIGGHHHIAYHAQHTR
ncbi:hypothetical protein D3C80_1656270 [compost metagenome]